MKIRRADKRYQPRHGLTWVEALQVRAGDFGTVLGWLAVFSVAGVTGYFLHDDATETARKMTGGSPAGMAAAGWFIVVASAGTSSGCLAVALRDRLHRALLLAFYAAAVVAAFPALWLLPRPRDRDPFGWASDALVHGSHCAYVLVFFAVATVSVSGPLQSWLKVEPLWNRKWLLGTAGVVTAVAAITLAAAVTLVD